jgi:hypothetical protein
MSRIDQPSPERIISHLTELKFSKEFQKCGKVIEPGKVERKLGDEVYQRCLEYTKELRVLSMIQHL